MRSAEGLSGASALIRQITAVESKIRAGAAEICARAADSAAQAAREIVPVETGALRGSIASHAQGLSAAATAAAPHAAMVEYGTSRMAPRPYMYPAAQAVRGDFFEAMRALSREASK